MKSYPEGIYERMDAVAQRAADTGMSSVHFSHIVDLAHRECTSAEGLLDYLEDKMAEWVSTQES